MPWPSNVGALIAAMASCCLPAASAAAAEWHTNGPLTANSTNAGVARVVAHGAGFSVAASCSTARAHVALNGPTSVAMPWTSAATVTPIISGCTVSGAGGYNVLCSSGELRVSSYAGGTTFATAGGGITTGSITIDCRLSFGATPCSTATGEVPAHLINPSPIGAAASGLTVTAAGQALRWDRIGAGCAAIPDGAGTFGSPGPGSTVTPIAYALVGPGAPFIYRTP